MEEKEHIIKALETKVTLLKGQQGSGDHTNEEETLIDLGSEESKGGVGEEGSQKVVALEGKLRI